MHSFDIRSFGYFADTNASRLRDEFYHVVANYNVFASTFARRSVNGQREYSACGKQRRVCIPGPKIHTLNKLPS